MFVVYVVTRNIDIKERSSMDVASISLNSLHAPAAETKGKTNSSCVSCCLCREQKFIFLQNDASGGNQQEGGGWGWGGGMGTLYSIFGMGEMEAVRLKRKYNFLGRKVQIHRGMKTHVFTALEGKDNTTQ